MGIDVLLYVEDFDDERDERYYYPGEGRPARIEVDTLSRAFGPYYNRGHWPSIYKAINALKECFPGKPIFYGGDSDHVAPLVDEEMLQSHWRAWTRAVIEEQDKIARGMCICSASRSKSINVIHATYCPKSPNYLPIKE